MSDEITFEEVSELPEQTRFKDSIYAKAIESFLKSESSHVKVLTKIPKPTTSVYAGFRSAIIKSGNTEKVYVRTINKEVYLVRK